MAPFLLSICIPTFSRVSTLTSLLERLGKELDGSCEVFVLDNASTDGTGDLVQKLQSQWPASGPSLTYVRNPINIGCGANILKAFLCGTAEWVMLMGDDDIPCAGMLSMIRRCLSEHPEASFIHFDKRLESAHPVECNSIDAFVESYYAYSQVFWMAAYIFNRAQCSPQVSLGNSYGMAAHAPHFVIALSSISNRSPAVLIPHDIATMWVIERWARSPIALGLRYLLRVPLECSKQTKRKLEADVFKHVVSPLFLWGELEMATTPSRRYQKQEWLRTIFTGWFFQIVRNPRLLAAWASVLFLDTFAGGRFFLKKRYARLSAVREWRVPADSVFSRL